MRVIREVERVVCISAGTPNLCGYTEGADVVRSDRALRAREKRRPTPSLVRSHTILFTPLRTTDIKWQLSKGRLRQQVWGLVGEKIERNVLLSDVNPFVFSIDRGRIRSMDMHGAEPCRTELAGR